MIISSNKCHATSNKCLTSSNKKLVVKSMSKPSRMDHHVGITKMIFFMSGYSSISAQSSPKMAARNANSINSFTRVTGKHWKSIEDADKHTCCSHLAAIL